MGNAENGLCGGMVFAARDLFEAGQTPPTDRRPPAPGTTLFRYLVRRVFASFDLPAGPLRYWAWMARPGRDRGSWRSPAHQTIEREWPQVKADLDAGILSPLGVIRTRSINPFQLGLNHQLLARSYEVDTLGGTFRIWVYDPNHPGEDGLAITIRPSSPDGGIDYIDDEPPVRGFFRARYRPPGRASRRLMARLADERAG